MAVHVRRLIAAIFVLGLLWSPAPARAALSPDTFFLIDVPQSQYLRLEFREPQATITASHAAATPYTSESLSFAEAQDGITRSFWISFGADGLQLGHSYTDVRLPQYASQGAPTASCDHVRATVSELAYDNAGTVTNLAVDMTCPDYNYFLTVRINSAVGYADYSTVPATFASVHPGETSDGVFTMTSAGTLPLVIGTLSISGYASDVFSILSDTCSGKTLAPGDSCTVSLRYAPNSLWNSWAELVGTVGNLVGSIYAEVYATPLDPTTVGPASLAFGNVPALGVSAVKVITVSWAGPGSGSVTGVTIDSASPSTFAVASNGCDGATLSDGQSCTIGIEATPPWMAAFTGIVHVDLGPVEGVRDVTVSATGLDPITMTPSLTLPQIRPGATVSGVITITSAAAVPIAINSLNLSSNDLSITSNGCGSSLPANSSCDIQITFAPPAEMNALNAAMEAATLYVNGAWPLNNRTAQVMASQALPSLNVTWANGSGAAHRWNFGNALARATASGTSVLVQVSSSDRVGSTVVSDTAAKMPVYVNRSANGGATWSTTVRVNPSTTHGIWPVVAASGRYVAVAWVAVPKVVALSNTAPRVLWVRVSSNGSNGSWASPVRLTSTTGRVDHPSIAMYGSSVAVSWTDSATGAVKVAVSRDHGATWHTTSVGTTSQAASWGRTAITQVAVYGSTVAVTWTQALYGAVRIRISANYGSTWAPISTLSTTSVGDRASVAILGSRIAVTSVDGSLGLWLRVRSATAWGPRRTVPHSVGVDREGAVQGYRMYTPAVALFGTTSVSVAVSGQYYYCGGCDYPNGEDLLWVESSTNGVTWAAPSKAVLADFTYLYEDDASIVWVSATKRYVLVSGYGYAYRTMVMTGTTPGLAPAIAGPGLAAPVAAPAPREATPPRAFAGPWGKDSPKP